MKINPRAIDRTGEIPTFFLTPEDMIFKNTVRCGWFGIFKKNKEVQLRWITIKTEAGKSFTPVFETEDGYQIPNKAVAENYLQCEITLPKLVSVVKHIHYQGNCTICNRFHIEDNSELIILVATEEHITSNICIEEDEDPYRSRCSDTNCTGWCVKKITVSQ